MENKKISNKNISDKEFFERCQSSEHWSCITTFIFGILASIFLFFCISIIGIHAIKSNNIFLNPVTSCIVFVSVLVKMEHELFKDLKNNKNERKKLCVELGISEDDCANSYKKLIKILPYITYLSIAQQMCKLNTNASQIQEEVLKGFFCIDNATIKKYVFEKEYTKEELEFYAQHSKENKLYENKAFIDRLFKLAIVQDGIHNDEWQLLMQTLADLKFNKNNINLFTKRYGPLRTEFEDDHNNGRNNDHKEDRKEDSSTKVHSVNALNPYYAILGLDSNATDKDIKRAYHNLALQHHPDLPKNAGRIQECEEMMAKINEAYEKVRG